MVIDGYSIGGFEWLLMAIGEYYICEYWWLLIDIILVVIGDYYINGYWWIFCYQILMVINCYYISGYWWLLMVIDEYFIVVIGGY